MGFRKKRKAIVSSITRAHIPGPDEQGGELVQPRTVPHVIAEKSRAAMMLGAREGETKSADRVYRDIGIPIFDVSAGRSQLHELLQRGRGR